MSYKKIGDFIELVDERNTELSVTNLLGLSISKQFIPSVANVVGTDMKNYKIIRKGQFACSVMQVRRDGKMPVALLRDYDQAIISQAYPVFKIKDETVLLPEYLMMWFTRSEFDREATFHAVGGVRGSLEWEDFLDFKLPVPSILKQREIVAEYNTVTNRIKLNEQLNQKLEETAQALYKHWFVDFEFPNLEGKPYKSSGGEMVYNEELDKEIPEGWEVDKLENRCSKIGSGSTPRGGKDSYKSYGVSLIRSMNVYDFKFKEKDLAFIDSLQAKKLNNVEVEKGDILFNITGASVARCCIVPENILPARVNQHVAIIRPAFKITNYLLLGLCSEEYKRKLIGLSESGSTRQAITKEDLELFSMLFPDEKIQLEFNRKALPIFSSIENRRLEIKAFSELQSVLLSKMSTIQEK